MTPHSYLFIVIFLGVALLFPIMPLILAWMWRRFFQPPRPGAGKNATYECGVESIGEAQIQFRSQYYLYAIIFLIFDVEAVFLVPFAAGRCEFGLACCAIEMIATSMSRLDIARFGGGGVPAIAAAGRPDDRGRNGHEENGATGRPALQPDA